MSEVVWSPGWREQQINKLRLQSGEQKWDLIVIGGGITGAGVFREATRRGLKVLLIDQKDFAWGTSSRSSKMVHGGLRYLGSGQFGLTLDSVKERQRLLQEAPGLVDPLNFLMGHYKGGFPGPFIFNILLTIYDWMAGKRNHKFIKRAVKDFFAPGMKSDKLKGATQFADAVTDDARLVLRVLHEAKNEGGVALNYLSAQDTIRKDGRVVGVTVKDELEGSCFDIFANAVINASGAWTDELRASLGADAVIRPLRGSHLIVPSWRLPAAYSVSFFHPKDKRPVFAFPWEGVTVIGTTDLDHQQSMRKDASITQEEVDYLIDAVNQQFPGAHIAESDVIASYSGVRPVVGTGSLNPSSEKREHSIWDDHGLISVAGGKLTTFRLIALDVLKAANDYLPDHDIDSDDAAIFKGSSVLEPELKDQSVFTAQQLRRLNGRYGRDAESIINHALDGELSPLETTETLLAELRWALENEIVVHLDDLLLRRTRLGLLLKEGGEAILERVKPLCQSILCWSDARWNTEVSNYRQLIQTCYGLPKQRDRGDAL
ncbi:glycerol-3-phosphate dehydrogenase/oxidase [Alkalimarinus sediminis]|uniref:Glycerol-3-phosphate dehydrogenase/oxidase n=1 Tax=Alkalimarinus sediminis TaxID=1632866 RepID=A0A9E8HJR3_9ALTE|nr:glycerol-3-phosphate dehydrogenase/oxidase [Alkalimarinus sediminis]UZW75684.1 glycerol-3-phosphate dehydrogenase/oxidase [Alkalimarinus sediminis]